MPGWHEATRELQDRDRLQMVGIIQEQHPDRARLFMQWKQMGWPILVDSLDLLRIEVVPRTFGIDEHGVIRHVGMRLEQAQDIEAMFLDREYPPSGEPVPVEAPPPVERALGRARSSRSPAAWRELGDALFLRGEPDDLDRAIAAYEQAVELDAGDGWSHFRLGVAYRARFDSHGRRPEDFRRASHHWSRALELDPNNYIWRRRIQQYGPRLDKPYSFYDWIRRAREDVRARGETPVELPVEPSDSELAYPQKGFETPSGAVEEPDPAGRIHRDAGELVSAEWAAVPARVEPGEALRLHLSFEPRRQTEAHWNNEVDDLVVWLELPAGWQVERRLLSYAVPEEPLSAEERTLEVEMAAPERPARTGEVRMPAYALYYVCEDIGGTCLYRRQDMELAWSLEPGS